MLILEGLGSSTTHCLTCRVPILLITIGEHTPEQEWLAAPSFDNEGDFSVSLRTR